MPFYEVVFKAETALAPEVVEAAGADVLRAEGMLVFEPVPGGKRPTSIPLRFLAQVTEEESGRVIYRAT